MRNYLVTVAALCRAAAGANAQGVRIAPAGHLDEQCAVAALAKVQEQLK